MSPEVAFDPPEVPNRKYPPEVGRNYELISVYMLFMLIFAVIAVELFKGKFYFCTDSSKRTPETCVGNFINYDSKYNIQVQPREWKRKDFHYDNVFHAFLTLFVISTGEGIVSRVSKRYLKCGFRMAKCTLGFNRSNRTKHGTAEK